ncbi:unnamed protein product [Ectocarpus sp. CCAP 1310/34]|nr:unnamed protein product [Ectocarpus sp. CCAP 1310/34]
MMCGADAEWQFSPRGREPLATFQIAALRVPSFLFHLQRGNSGFTKETFPAPLKALLEDPSIIKAGVAINTDATHMLNDYGVKMASTVGLRVLAVSKLVVTSSQTLAGLTACLLGRQLPKDTVRCSRWGSAQLSVEQRDCAIRDAVASALFYEAIHTNKDPITSVPSSPFDPAVGLKVSAYALWYRPYFDVDRQQQIMAGSKFVLKPKQQRLPSFFCPLRVLQVRLYNASHSACVAVGHVVSDATVEAALRHWQSSAKLQGLSGSRQRDGVVVRGSGAGGDPVEGSPISAGPGAGAAGAARAALPQFRACIECGHHKGAYPAEHPGNRRGHKAKGSAPQPDLEPAKNV